MSGLSIGPATDYLVLLATSAVSSTTINGDPVLVVDGWPDAMAFGMFVVGLNAPPPEVAGDVTGSRMWAELGAQRVKEDYTIPCYIDTRLTGTQKQARDAAHGIFDAFWALLKADLTLGGALISPGYAEITDFASTPSNVGTAAEEGHRQFLTFGVHCTNRPTT